MKSKKAIFDTNLWISFLISKDFHSLDKYILNGKIKLIFSEELLSEFILVAGRPKLKRFFTEPDLKQLISLINKYGKLVKVNTATDICRDKKDNFLLNLAIDSNADYLITGDYDLLDLKFIGHTKILTINEVLNELQP
jgi:uncharacterized protein